METETENFQEIKIDQILPEDWQKYKALWLEALTDSPQAFGFSYDELTNRTDEEWQEKIRKNLAEGSKSRMFIAKDGEKFIGMMGFFEKRENITNVFGVYVNPQFRGKKISDKLMEAVLNSLKQELDFSEVELTVNKNQTAAVEFYKRYGFLIVEEIKDVKMGDNTVCDEYLMKREIK
ncbi:MAG: GNAT family N-acetyltransferase [Candidatus Uhrbacteria bacterium]